MNVDFGTTVKYFQGRGFGFVGHTFRAGFQSEVFFHIKTIKKTHPQLVERLKKDGIADGLCFWYETEVTTKGEQVRTALRRENIYGLVARSSQAYIEKIEGIWNNLDSSLPIWLHEVTVDLIGADLAGKLRSERSFREEQRRKADEVMRLEREIQWKIKEAERQKAICEQEAQEDVEEQEFQQLAAEMKQLGFRESRDVSRYIVRNQLGSKYKNISGVVKMAQNGDMWDLKGGFPPNIYARLCNDLNLGNQGTYARAIGFKSYKSLTLNYAST